MEAITALVAAPDEAGVDPATETEAITAVREEAPGVGRAGAGTAIAHCGFATTCSARVGGRVEGVVKRVRAHPDRGYGDEQAATEEGDVVTHCESLHAWDVGRA